MEQLDVFLHDTDESLTVQYVQSMTVNVTGQFYPEYVFKDHY